MMPSSPVVLLHGAGGSYQSAFVAPGWAGALEVAGRTPIGLELPGHGSPTASRDPSAYADLAGMLLPLLPTRQFDAIGFSLGAKLLLELAIRAPGRIGRMVLGGIGDNVFGPEGVAPALADALERGISAQTPPGVLAFLKTWNPGSTDPLALAAVMRRPPNPEFTPQRLSAVRNPVLIVNGALDPLLSLGNRLIASLPHVRSLVLPDTGHFELTSRGSFIAAAVEFLNLREMAPNG